MHKQRISQHSLWRLVLPNMITCAALACGVTAIRLAIDNNFMAAVMAVILAILLDAIDGRVARALDGSTAFGAELDSLADLINFGVAPGVIVWLWSLHGLGNVGWVGVVCFAIACGLRLARFNVSSSDPDAPAWKSSYFTGVNAPAGAVLALVPLYLGFSGFDTQGAAGAPYIVVYLITVATLMVSRLPTFSFKRTRIGAVGRWGLIIGSLAILPAMYHYTWSVLVLACTVYIALIPFAVLAYRRDALLERNSATIGEDKMELAISNRRR